MQKTSRVLIIYTGGTIGMKPDTNASLSASDIGDFFNNIEQTKDEYLSDKNNFTTPLAQEFANKNIDKKDKKIFLELANKNIIDIKLKTLNRIDSSDISPKIWSDIASTIYKKYDKYDGFVVLCGTDTMAYTSSALSFMLLSLNKPIVLTGSISPIYEDNSDAIPNTINAINIAGADASLLPKICEVAIIFGSKIIRGSRATKINSIDKNPFLSPNYPLLGKIDEKIEIDKESILASPDKNMQIILNSTLTDKIALLYFHPLLEAKQIENIILNKKIDGIVLISYGSGNIKIDKKILKILIKAISKKNKVILNISQCIVGGIDMNLYKNGKTLSNIGVVDGGDMTLECAITKLSFVLANYSNDYAHYLQRAVVGEIDE
jgi:L-asparaginase type I